MRERLHTVFFVCLLTAPGIAVSAATGGIQIISSTEDEFHFTVSINSSLTTLDPFEVYDGGVIWGQTVLVAIPVGARVDVVSAEGRGLVPVSGYRSPDKNPAVDFPLVHVSQPFTVRGREMVNVLINPIVGERIYSTVDVNLAFEGGQQTGLQGSSENAVFDRMFQASLANYETARKWPVRARRTETRAALSTAALQQSDEWFKVTVTQTGLYQITGAQMAAAGISLSGLSSDDIRLFNAGGLRLPESNDSARPELKELAILVEDGGDGLFGSGDRIYFYGESVDRWLYRPNVDPEYVHNPYTKQNVYWLTVTGDFTTPARRVNTIDGSPTTVEDTLITMAIQRTHAEQNSLLSRDPDNHVNDYLNWYWTDSTELTFFVPAPDAVPGAIADLTFVGKVNVGTGGAAYMDVAVNGTPAFGKLCNSRTCLFQSADIVDGLNEIGLSLGPQRVDIPPYFDYAEVAYSAFLRPNGNRLDIPIGPASGKALIEIDDDFSATPIIFQLDDPLQPVMVTGFERSGDKLSFLVDLSSTGPNRFYLSPKSQALSPVSITRADFEDLRKISNQVDMIVVTGASLAPYLGDYIAYRERQSHAIKVVDVSDIMDVFGFGLYDPTAIRDYLKFAYQNYPAPAPATALLVGDGTYDFLDHSGIGSVNIVPPYTQESDVASSDDSYVHFGATGILDSDTSYVHASDRGLDMVIARWPVRTANEIRTITDKTMKYESSSTLGRWRTHITAVADDQFGQQDNETFHTVQAEELLNNHVPPAFGRDKIYLWAFPFVNRYKPAVNDAIVNAFNSGSLVIDYIGHGNPDVWAHERVFVRSTDLPRLHNDNLLPLVFAASCAISFFDDPQREGMGEDLLSMTGGAIGVVAATRLVYSSANASFNNKAFDVLLSQDSLSLCEGVYTAKLLRQYPDTIAIRRPNDQKYAAFADPLLKLAVPNYDVVFDEVPSMLIPLDRARVSGYVADSTGSPVLTEGTVFVTARDADRQKVLYLNESDKTGLPYTVEGASIFRGTATVTGGRFDLEFIVPLDVEIGGTGARLSAYAILEDTDGMGGVEGIDISDSVIITADSTGPVITYGISGRENFVSGDLVSRSEMIELRFTDPTGINLSDNLGHGISLQIDHQVENTIALNESFEYDRDNVTTGTAQFPLAGLEPGPHEFQVTAWDNADNLSVITFAAEITASTQLAIDELLNYPNPMRDSTTFYFTLTRPADRFSLEIFTLSGRKIWVRDLYSLSADSYPNGSVSLVWNGRDLDGDRVATGVYIYRASASAPGDGDGVELFGKVVVVN
jgi:hypothetical protein